MSSKVTAGNQQLGLGVREAPSTPLPHASTLNLQERVINASQESLSEISEFETPFKAFGSTAVSESKQEIVSKGKKLLKSDESVEDSPAQSSGIYARNRLSEAAVPIMTECRKTLSRNAPDRSLQSVSCFASSHLAPGALNALDRRTGSDSEVSESRSSPPREATRMKATIIAKMRKRDQPLKAKDEGLVQLEMKKRPRLTGMIGDKDTIEDQSEVRPKKRLRNMSIRSIPPFQRARSKHLKTRGTKATCATKRYRGKRRGGLSPVGTTSEVDHDTLPASAEHNVLQQPISGAYSVSKTAANNSRKVSVVAAPEARKVELQAADNAENVTEQDVNNSTRRGLWPSSIEIERGNKSNTGSKTHSPKASLIKLIIRVLNVVFEEHDSHGH